MASPIHASPVSTITTTAAAAVDVEDLTNDEPANDEPAPPLLLRTIWEDAYCDCCVQGTTSGFECKWCGIFFKHRHHTRAVSHFAKIAGKGMAICSAAIPAAYLAVYQKLFQHVDSKIKARKRVVEEQDNFVAERLALSTNSLVVNKRKR